MKMIKVMKCKDKQEEIYWQFDQSILNKMLKLLALKPHQIEFCISFIYNSVENKSSINKNELIQILSQLIDNFLNFYKKSVFINSFKVAYKIIKRNIPLVFLIGGTCGTGKSTIASSLGIKFQAESILSSDSVRHILRNFLNKQQKCKQLFGSTYDCYKLLPNSQIQGMQLSEKIIYGYQKQCKVVQQYLQKIIACNLTQKKILILQGVHLTPNFMYNMWKKYDYVMPFFIYIKNQEKHKERFAVRSKFMTIEPKVNKYTANIDNIRLIQKFLLDQCKKYQIPKIPNSNIDKTIETIFQTTLKYIKKYRKYCKQKNQQENSKNMEPLMKVFRKISQLKGWIKKQINNLNQGLIETDTSFTTDITKKQTLDAEEESFNSIDQYINHQMEQESETTDIDLI